MTAEALDLSVWPIFFRMSRRGLMVSFERLEALLAEVRAKKEEQLFLCGEFAGRPINPNSGDDVGAWLAEQGFTGKRTKTTHRLATDERSLSQYDHPAIDCILQYRGLNKLEGTFILPVIEKAEQDRVEGMLCGVVHPRWRLTKVRSGRVATEDPNLLAFPSRDEMGKKVRSCFVARPGYKFVSADYSQLEPRIVAALSGDPKLLRIYGEDRDLYLEIANDLIVTRTVAKILTLGILYGMGPHRLYEQLLLAGCKNDDGSPIYSEDACGALIEKWFATYPSVRKLVQGTINKARAANGWAFTHGLRGRFLPGLFLEGRYWPNSKLREEAERQSFNHIVQGTGMECLKEAMVRIDQANLPDIHFLLAIHDELVFEVPEGSVFAAPAIVEHMRTNFCGVELKVSASEAGDWGSLE